MSGQNKIDNVRKSSSSSSPVYTKPFFTYRPKGFPTKKDDLKCNPTVDKIGTIHPKTYEYDEGK